MKQFTANLLKQISPQIKEEIRKTPLLEFEYDEVANLLVLAADLYLQSDLRYADALFEQEWEQDGLVGVFDIVLIAPSLPKWEQAKIVDWKTTSNVDRPNHGEEIKNDIQTSMYLGPGSVWLDQKYGILPKFLEYRALDYRLQDKLFLEHGDQSQHTGHSKVYTVERKPVHLALARAMKASSDAMYGALRDFAVWPQRRRQCYAYGDTCPFIDDCNNLTMPKDPIDFDTWFEATPHSKSSLASFLECPEKYRRTRVLGAEAGDTSAINVGEAFHAGARILWSEAFKRKGTF